MSAHRASRPVHVRAPKRHDPASRVRELWSHRRQLAFFGRRLIEKRYVRTWLGMFWIPLRPALDVAMRTLLFGGLLAVSSEGLPYMVYFSVGMAAWMMFESSALWATRSLEVNRGVLRRIDVPRVVPLVSAIAPALLDLGLYLAIAAIALVYYGIADGTNYVQSPFGADGLLALGGLATLALIGIGIGMWTSPFVAQARDIRFGFSYVTGLWLFLTPVIYAIDSIPEAYRPLAEHNPATAPVEAFKHALLGTPAPSVTSWTVSLVTMAVLLASGSWFSARKERDVLHYH
jgi:lipopolysaccharide transport system permease protein